MSRRRFPTVVQDFNPAGVILDTPAEALGPESYSNCLNMRNTGAGMTRVDGVQEYVPSAILAPQWGIAFVIEDTPMLLYAGDAGVAVTDGLGSTNVTPGVGWHAFNAGEMTGGLLNGFPCFNVANMVPWYFDGTVVAPLPGWLAGKATQVLAPFNAHLFAGSIIGASTDYELLAWSDLAAPGTVPATWTPTATNQAGDLTLGTGVGPVTAMLGLGPNLMVYRTSGCWAVSYVGRPYIYTARKLTGDVGAGSMNSVAQVMGSHAVIAPGDLVLTDGTNVRSIGEGRVKSSLFAQVSATGLKRCHAYVLPGSNECVFAMAVGRDDACNLAYVWDFARDRWSIRELPLATHTFTGVVPIPSTVDTWDSDAGTWESDEKPWDAPPAGGFIPHAVSCSPSAAKLFQLDTGQLTMTGANVAAFVERTGLRLGQSTNVKHIVILWPRLTGTAGDTVFLRMGTQLDAASPVLWDTEVPFVIGVNRRLGVLLQGRLAAVRARSESAGTWSISGFGIEYAERGYQ